MSNYNRQKTQTVQKKTGSTAIQFYITPKVTKYEKPLLRKYRPYKTNTGRTSTGSSSPEE